MRWKKYIFDRFDSVDNYTIIENGETIIVNSSNLNENLDLIFVLDKNNLKEIYASYSKSRIILDFTSFVTRSSYLGYFKDKENLKEVNAFLDTVIFEGWREKLFIYKGKCFKINIFFEKEPKPISLKIPFLSNWFFYLQLSKDCLLKDFDTILYMNPVVEEEEFIISPLQRE